MALQSNIPQHNRSCAGATTTSHQHNHHQQQQQSTPTSQQSQWQQQLPQSQQVQIHSTSSMTIPNGALAHSPVCRGLPFTLSMRLPPHSNRANMNQRNNQQPQQVQI